MSLQIEGSPVATNLGTTSRNRNITPAQKDRIYKHVSQYQRPNGKTALVWFATTIIPFIGLQWWSQPWTLPLAVLFRVRLFILTHDMAHGSFFPHQRNQWNWNTIGASILMPLVSYTPYSFWNRIHTYHHAHANKLDKEDTPWTLRYFSLASQPMQWMYTLLNHPFMILSGLIPSLMFFIVQQIQAFLWELGLEGLLLWAHCSRGTLAFELISAILGATVGMLLFNVQHTFHGVERRRTADAMTLPEFTEGNGVEQPCWDAVHNAIYGCSLLVVPYPLSFFTAGLEYHHIHHLNTRIPCYFLKSCHDSASDTLFTDVKRVRLIEMLTILPYSLWDEETGALKRPIPRSPFEKSALQQERSDFENHPLFR
jgi:omega-6 fatty acid desaturase (delta-12 desaturase)